MLQVRPVSFLRPHGWLLHGGGGGQMHAREEAMTHECEGTSTNETRECVRQQRVVGSARQEGGSWEGGQTWRGEGFDFEKPAMISLSRCTCGWGEDVG